MTWASYALIVSFCLFAYYLTVAIIYRKTFGHLFKRGANLQSFDSLEVPTSDEVSSHLSSTNLFGEQVADEELKIVAEEDAAPSEAQEFAGEVEAYTTSCDEAISKDRLIASLRKIIQKYPSLIHSESKYELTQLIAMYCENYCSVHLSADELQALWNN